MVMDVKGYEELANALERAYDQSARGKGLTRHGNGLPFIEQPILEIARMTGVGGHIYQVMKKAQEAKGMADRGEHDAAVGELCGVIVYAAAAMTFLQEQAVPVRERVDYTVQTDRAARMANGGGAGLKDFKAELDRIAKTGDPK